MYWRKGKKNYQEKIRPYLYSIDWISHLEIRAGHLWQSILPLTDAASVNYVSLNYHNSFNICHVYKRGGNMAVCILYLDMINIDRRFFAYSSHNNWRKYRVFLKLAFHFVRASYLLHNKPLQKTNAHFSFNFSSRESLLTSFLVNLLQANGSFQFMIRRINS